MSRVHRGVLRAVRLLPQAVKIGIEPESAPSPEQDEEQTPHNEALQDDASAALPEEGSSPSGGDLSAPENVARGPDPELLSRIEELEAALEDTQARLEQTSAAREKLESEIEGVKADYAKRRKEVEDGAAAVAEQAAAEARSQGHQEGWDAGQAEGLAAARAEVEKEYLDRFAALTASLEGIKQRLEDNFAELVTLNRPRMLRLWSEMLRRMLCRQVELSPDTVNGILADILSRISDRNQLVIYVSPEDQALLEADMDTKFQEVLRGVRHLELKADSNVDRGSCIVETGLGVYDARWRTQLEQVDAAVDKIFQQIAHAPEKLRKRQEAAPAADEGEAS